MKEKLKKIAGITMWVILIAGLFFSLGFAEKNQKDVVGKGLTISIEKDEKNYFIEQSDIREMLREKGDSIVNQPIRTININELEKVLNSHSAVANANIFVTGNGIVNINIKQRVPVVRVYNWNNESYYIDEEAKVMPLSEKYSSRILVANGYINEPYEKRYMYSIDDINQNPFAKAHSILDDIYAIATFIEADPFWKAQIKQLYVNEERDIEMIPTAGDHRIIFGDSRDIESKFKKLMTFYKEGLNTTGAWGKYSIVNLKFKDQIVCTKK
jgi:cell division protein FtsQ